MSQIYFESASISNFRGFTVIGLFYKFFLCLVDLFGRGFPYLNSLSMFLLHVYFWLFVF